MKKGNRVAKAAIEFEPNDGLLAGFHLVGFTICDDPEKDGLFVLFPAVNAHNKDGDGRTFFFLRPSQENMIRDLEEKILDVYESMTAKQPFNAPHVAPKAV